MDQSDRQNTLTVFPDWFRTEPAPEDAGLSEAVRNRFRRWNRVWEDELNPQLSIEWSDIEVGREWIREGRRIVRALQHELGPGVVVVEGFERYDPDAQ